MFAILLISLGTFFNEIAESVGKKEVHKKNVTVFGMSFLNTFWAVVFLTLIVLFLPNNFLPFNLETAYRFSFDSLPTFLTRVVCEITALHLVMKGLTTATRTTFTFLRTLTIPLLLLVDLIIGYNITPSQIIGIFIIIITTFSLLGGGVLQKKGVVYVIGSAMMAVATTSLFKYDITHYNSVTGEQLTLSVILLLYLYFATLIVTKRNPIRHFKRPMALLQSLAFGFGYVTLNFGLAFVPGSVMIAAKRTSAVLWSIFFGKVYFQETKFSAKIGGLILLGLGLFLLTNPF